MRRGLGTGLERISEGGCQSKAAACIYFNLWQEINIYTRKRWETSLCQASAAHQLQLQDHLAGINELEDKNLAEKTQKCWSTLADWGRRRMWLYTEGPLNDVRDTETAYFPTPNHQ